ncbi:MAG: DUF4426 domain-containing protein [Cellvibrionales bacterium]|nr:DUF4426 domain-containing protein [Cellvibrionales bacterium]
MMKALIFFTLFLPLFVWGSTTESLQQPYSASQNQVKYGDFEINFVVFNSTFIQPGIASAANLVRSPKIAYVNINVVKINSDGSRQKHHAKVTGNVFDLIIRKDLEFVVLEEKDAVYYFAPVEIQHKIPLYFTFYVTPDGMAQPKVIKMKKVLYAD